MGSGDPADLAHIQGFPAVASCGCLAIVGATLLAQADGGLYWLVPSVVAVIFFGLVNAWVLLVEIKR